ncbi:MAG: hypothetical protein L6R30_13805 [Thermoanaerobaculia bacterium]|nr:hypothetical protein [Thermoanaerobaculia bacterium]MCK6683478.1 hypothetical protein [Thermoanaerobaculia bacterium]
MQNRLLRILFIVYLLEAGAFLTMSPWSRFWQHRIAGQAPEFWASLLMSPFVRGFVSGVGLLHLMVAIRDLELWRREASRPDPLPFPQEREP